MYIQLSQQIPHRFMLLQPHPLPRFSRIAPRLPLHRPMNRPDEPLEVLYPLVNDVEYVVDGIGAVGPGLRVEPAVL